MERIVAWINGNSTYMIGMLVLAIATLGGAGLYHYTVKPSATKQAALAEVDSNIKLREAELKELKEQRVSMLADQAKQKLTDAGRKAEELWLTAKDKIAALSGQAQTTFLTTLANGDPDVVACLRQKLSPNTDMTAAPKNGAHNNPEVPDLSVFN